MGVIHSNKPPESHKSLRSIVIFSITFFLVTVILTALIIIPKTNRIVESQHSNDIQDNLKLEAKLFTHFVQSHKTILQDLAQFPSLVNAAMLSDASNPVLIDLFDNVVIGGDSGRILLQDIASNILIQSNHELKGHYLEGSTWSDQLLDGSIPFYFQLLSQKGDIFTFQLSIPINYNSSIEGLLSAEITVPLEQAFVALPYSNAAFKLVQDNMTVSTESSHIKIPREDKIQLSHPNLTFIYITDDAFLRDKERLLKNTIFLVLLSGLGISFLLFTLFGYRSLITRQKGHKEKFTFQRTYAMPIANGAIGLASSITAFLLIHNSQLADLESNLQSESKQQIQILRKKLHGSLQVLDSMKAFFDASSFVDRDQFKTFATPHLANHTNIQSLEWVPNILLSERNYHETHTRLKGLRNYAIHEQNADGKMVPAGPRANYFPVYYAESDEGNQKLIGFDLSSNSKRLSTLTKAAQNGNKVATGPIVVDQGEVSQSVLQVFSPVYHPGQSHESVGAGAFTIIRGYVLLTLRTDDLVEDTSTDGPEIRSIHIQDISSPGHPENIFGDKVPNADYTFSESIDVAGRVWHLETTVSSAVAPKQWLSWLILICGALLTALLTTGLIHLIHRREKVESLVKQRTSELRLLSSIVANSNDSFMITDALQPDQKSGRRKIVYVNEAFTRLTGYSYAEAVGETPFLLHGEETDKIRVKELTESISKGISFRGEFIYYKKNKETHWVEINVVSIKNEEGVITHYGAVQRDITSSKQAQSERESLIENLVDSNEELARFAFVCSHDLQEPLRMIRSFTEKLQTHIGDHLAQDEKAKKYFGFVTDGAQRAQELITDILEYSSIANSTEQLVRIDSMELIAHIKQVMGATLENNGGKITHDVLPVLHGNKTQLYQLFQNLINNAIKYQQPDIPPHIHIDVTDAGIYWQFSIKDNGIGMEQRHLHKIFDVFQRLHRKNQYAGTGVGLSICKKVVDRHGGTVTVESEPGVGSVFYFTLPKPTLMEISDERDRKAS